MTDKRNLRIFCPTHEAAFESAESPKILCEITEHALSVGFPHSEFWEFCCNCETFSPAKLDKGDKAQNNCYACSNEISKRFACADCKVIGFESNAQTKGRSYFITANGIEPACPGCQTVSQNGALTLHKCKEIEAGFFTARAECPFCLEKIAIVNSPIKTATPVRAEGVCPQCRAANPPSAVFCGKCKYKMRDNIAIMNLGSDVNKTQLLGSLCPNCSIPIPPDSDFCGECGQAVKKSVAPPPPPPPKSVVNNPTIETQASPISAVSMNNQTRNVLIGIGGFFLLVVIVVIASSISKSSSDNYTTYSAGNTNTTNANQYGNTTSNSERNFSVVGKYGYVTTNINVRTGPDRRYDDIGTFYQDTKVKILQVAKRDGESDWWEVEVENSSDYGCSSVDYSICGKDDPSDATRGWINSKNVVFR